MSIALMDASDIRRTLGRMAHEILEANHGADSLVVVGVLRRGWPIAKRLAFLMTQIEGTTVPCAKIDAKPYRDDKVQVLEEESDVPFDLNGKKVVLVDEVIYTGRTVRAAMDSLMEHGRPARVQLAVLIDRGHRELPIQPDFCGRTLITEVQDHILVKTKEVDGEDEVVLEKLSPVSSMQLGANTNT